MNSISSNQIGFSSNSDTQKNKESKSNTLTDSLTRIKNNPHPDDDVRIKPNTKFYSKPKK